jgi:arginine exporter protein ArgO
MRCFYISQISQISQKIKFSAVLLLFFYASNVAFNASNCQKARKTGKNALDKKNSAICFCCVFSLLFVDALMMPNKKYYV